MNLENTNKAIAVNSIILYVRLIANLVCSLFATRFALQALGVSDYGLYAVLGGVISFMAILNTIMVSTTNRYISVAIGKGDDKVVNEQFNVNLLIHICIAVLTLIIMLPLGDWYVHNYVNYDGSMNLALKVMFISLIGSVISFISVPYNGLLVAKENFLIFCLVDVIAHFSKLIVSYLLINNFNEKLLIYTIAMALFTALPTIIYYIYCTCVYSDVTKFRFIKDIDKYKEVLGFSVWVGYGAVASVAKSQGAAIIINMFFNTLMNTALSVASTVNSLITLLSQNISQPISPQLVKSYAANNLSRCDDLLIAATKYTYLLSFIVAMPLLVETEWVINLWLGEVPAYAVTFTRLLMIDTLITALNSGISNIIFASGKIRMYQLIINTLRLLSIVGAYFILKAGFPSYTLLMVYIFFSVLIFFATQIVLNRTLGYDNRKLWKYSYIPSLVVTVASLILVVINMPLPPLVNMLFYVISIIIFVILFAFTRNEKVIIISWIKAKFQI